MRPNLVITIALKNELPLEYIKEQGFDLFSRKSLQDTLDNKLSQSSSEKRSIIFFITGVGPDNSKQSAEWIVKYLNPKRVLNIGTVGIQNSKAASSLTSDSLNHYLSKWVIPKKILNENNDEIKHEIDSEFLERISKKLAFQTVESLQTVSAPALSKDSAKITKKANPVITHNDAMDHDFAVDMEAFEQAKVFSQAQTAFNSIKWVSDVGPSVPSIQEFKERTKIFRKCFEDLLRSQIVC